MGTRASGTAGEPPLSSNTKFQRTPSSWVLGRPPLELASDASGPRLLGERLAIAGVLEGHLREHGLPAALSTTLPPGVDASELMAEHRDDLARQWHAVGDAAAYQVAARLFTGNGHRELTSDDAQALRTSVEDASDLRMEWVATAPREAEPRAHTATQPGTGWAAAQVDALVALPGRPAMMSDKQWEAENRAVDQDGKAADKAVLAERQIAAARTAATGEEYASLRASSGANKGARTRINELGEAYRDFAEQEADASAAEHGPWYVRGFSRDTPLALPAAAPGRERDLGTAQQAAHAAGPGLPATRRSKGADVPVPESARAYLPPEQVGKAAGRLPAGAARNTGGLPPGGREYGGTVARQVARDYRPRGSQQPRAHEAGHGKGV